MLGLQKILIVFGFLVMLSSFGKAFFWGSSEPVKQPSPWPIAYYQQRYLQAAPPTYNLPPIQQAPIQEQNLQIPAIPIQYPLQAQLTPTANIHNVQLVPCLCPVSQDFDYENKQPQESLYSNHNQIKPQNP